MRNGLIVLFVLSSLHNGLMGFLSVMSGDLLRLGFAIPGFLINAFGIFAVFKGKRSHFVGLRILVILELLRDVAWLVLFIRIIGFNVQEIHWILLFFVLPVVLQTSIICFIRTALGRLDRMKLNEAQQRVQQVPSMNTVM